MSARPVWRRANTETSVNGSKTFEILTLRDGRWSIQATATSQKTAQEEAAKLLSRKDVEGVRVVQESNKSFDKLKPEDILFEKLRPKSEGKVFVQDIDDAPVCHGAGGLFSRSGRITINRLFRTYLDKNDLTATEVMHSAREMKRLLDEGTLVSSAVAKAATFQARKIEGSSTNERRDTLYEFINEIDAQARAVANRKLPRIRDVGFNDAIGEVQAAANGDAGYLARVVIANELLDTRSYFGKLGQTMEWAAGLANEEHLEPLDIFTSDILNNTDVIRELIGDQRDLGSALVTMICLSEGETLDEDDAEPVEDLDPEHADFPNFKLRKLIAEGKLPESRSVLHDRIRRQLEGINPLSRGDREEEREVFHGLLEKLIPDINIVGGPEMAEAVTARQSTIINKGGHKGMKEAAASVLPTLADPARKTGYLLSLMESRIGREVLRDDIESLLDSFLVNSRNVNQLVREKLPPNKKMAKITSIYNHINNSGLPDERKARLTSRLDELLASYIVDGKILEKVDNPDRPLHIRAFMLVSMVQPETLPRGKAQKLAREIIVKHLKRPNFETELVAQIADPKEQAITLRRFHQRLQRSGFYA